ncbi:hypothetical protein OHA70_31505 [Kribbella sp. NBC_00382]|uniref:hypothetical protein n=1 Tax=Kribbella sp. NBC_00382 TaxID=2975967 RepID=UPI002E1CB71F
MAGIAAAGLCLVAIGGGLYVGLFGLGHEQGHTVSYNSTGEWICTDSRHLVFKDGGTISLCEGSEFLGADGFTGKELHEAVNLVKDVAGDGRVDKADQHRLDELSERISRNHGEDPKPHSTAGLIAMAAGLLGGCCLVLVALISRSLRRSGVAQG